MSDPTVDLIVFTNIWNEVVHGFTIDNFESSIGITYPEAANLLATIQNERNTALHDLSAAEIAATARALEACIAELQWEFPIRVGVERAEAQAVIKKHLESVGRP